MNQYLLDAQRQVNELFQLADKGDLNAKNGMALVDSIYHKLKMGTPRIPINNYEDHLMATNPYDERHYDAEYRKGPFGRSKRPRPGSQGASGVWI